MRRLLLLSLFLAAPCTAQTDNQDVSSANFMVPYCRLVISDPGRDFWSGTCFGEIVALLNAEPFLSVDLKACVPSGVTPAQATQVVLNYIDARPQLMHKAFLVLAVDAMKAAWPCR